MPKPDLDVRWLYYAIHYHKLGEIDDGSPIPSTTRAAVYVRELEVPSKETQHKIGRILGGIDDKIEVNHRSNQTLEDIAQTIFKSWFFDFDPVKAKIAANEEGRNPLRAAMRAISGKSDFELDGLPREQFDQLTALAALFPDEMQDSELGKIPNGWNIACLYDTAEYVNGSAFKGAALNRERIGKPVIKISELKQGISSSTKYTLSQIEEKYAISDGDVLYSWSGSPETSLDVFKWFGGEGWLNQHIFKLGFDSEPLKHFTYFLLKEMKPQLVSTAKQKQTTGLGHVTVSDMKRMRVVKPAAHVLQEFSKRIAPVYERASECIKEAVTLSTLRDTLLPKLLSGELSVDAVVDGGD